MHDSYGERANENRPDQNLSPDTEPTQSEPALALERMRPGMTVVDRAGEEIGTVVKVYMTAGVGTAQRFTEDAYIRVGDRGVFRLGADLYVPAHLVSEVTEDRIVMDFVRDQIGDLVFDRPMSIPADDE